MLAPEIHLPLYAALDQAANKAQRVWRKRYVRSLVMLTVIAIVLSVGDIINFYIPLPVLQLKALRIVLAVFGAGGLVYEIFYAVRHTHRFGRWIQVRAGAEQLKSRAWLILVGARPMPETGAAYSVAEWPALLAAIVAGGPVPAAGPLLAADEGLALERQRFLHLPLVEQVSLYRRERIEEQHRYFTARVAWLERRTRRHQRALLLLLGAAVGWVALRAAAIWFDLDTIFQFYNLVPVLVGVVASLKAYVATEKIESLLDRYRSMAADLAAHLARPAPTDAAALGAWVERMEDILLSQNREWQVQRQRE